MYFLTTFMIPNKYLYFIFKNIIYQLAIKQKAKISSSDLSFVLSCCLMFFWLLEDVPDKESLEDSQVPHVNKEDADAANSVEDTGLVDKV